MLRLFGPYVAAVTSALVLMGLLASSSTTSAKPPTNSPDLLGVWSGRFTMVTAEGTSHGTTYYEFTEQTGNLVKGKNRWVVDSDPGAQDDDRHPSGTNEFLGVIAQDGTVFLVADGDTAIRRLRMTNDHTIDFVEMAGGEGLVVVSVSLTRNTGPV